MNRNGPKTRVHAPAAHHLVAAAATPQSLVSRYALSPGGHVLLRLNQQKSSRNSLPFTPSSSVRGIGRYASTVPPAVIVVAGTSKPPGDLRDSRTLEERRPLGGDGTGLEDYGESYRAMASYFSSCVGASRT